MVSTKLQTRVISKGGRMYYCETCQQWVGYTQNDKETAYNARKYRQCEDCYYHSGNQAADEEKEARKKAGYERRSLNRLRAMDMLQSL